MSTQINKTFSNNLSRLLNEHEKSQYELANYLDVSNQTITNYVKGYNSPRMDKVDKIASFFGVSRIELLGNNEIDLSKIPGIIPLQKAKRIPILGIIACGSPIWAEENFEGYFIADETIKADFILKAKGDSMIDAEIYDGDLVFLKKTPDVESGKIAAVLINNEATLKKVVKGDDFILLQPCNDNYKPILLNENSDAMIIGETIGVYHPHG